ncbi:MAG: ATP-binding cassette domain-containing protein [Oscillospiraceae bacterium]|jgi:energy-coupling factor transport system ATP-binding protein|nr:ATP-binding cassette domain-containing protein [Oscillospiraceae bacterium]
MESYRVEELTFTYPRRAEPALRGVSLTIGGGEFVTLCGPSGCGKTTLLRQLKPSLSPHGEKSGRIFFEGADLGSLGQRGQSEKIGFVMQSPENQIVTDKVWHELAFGLESLGLDTPAIRRRVAEMASFFGIQAWFYKNVSELSGGQKQLLNLASVMALQPSALILDEPTSQLDPIAASEFIATIGKINRELGVTVLLTEHRLEEVFPLSDRAVVMDGGRVIADGAPREAGLALRERGHGMFLAMPTAMRVWAACAGGSGDPARTGAWGGACPVTVRDGAKWLERMPLPAPGGGGGEAAPRETGAERTAAAPAVRFDDVWFKYEKNAPDVVKGLSCEAFCGELFAILGGNGTGKTTALSLAARLNTPYRGKIFIDGREVDKIPDLFDGLLGVLPQNPQSIFVKKTVREDLLEILSEMKLSKDEKQRRLARMASLCRLDGLLDEHPYDLSGGEQQRAALAKVLLLQPKILLLDEPTKGLDAEFKQIFAGILKKLTAAGACVVMVSHDVEFCAEHAGRCALFFDGSIVSEGAPREFFSGNSFYTSSANRMARRVLPEAVTARDIVAALGGETAAEPVFPDGDAEYELAAKDAPAPKKETARLTAKRLIAAAASAALFIAAGIVSALNFDGLKSFVSGGNEAELIASNSSDARLYVGIMLAFAAGIIGLTLSLTYKRDEYTPPPLQKRKLPKRTVAAAAMILLLIPFTIYIGEFYLRGLKYYFIALLIIIETMVPFALVFESRKPQARELVVIAALCAIAVAGRTAFFMLPQFKPIIALVIIAGVAFGGEAGFLVGAISMFVSNFFLSQGPFAPWQMFAAGVIGFLAGLLFRKGLLRRAPASLAVFGAFACVVIYGGIMNPSMVLIYQAPGVKITKEMLLAAYLQGIPFDLVHAAATVTFMLVISRPMLEKLDRIKIKYGLVE